MQGQLHKQKYSDNKFNIFNIQSCHYNNNTCTNITKIYFFQFDSELIIAI